MNVTFKKDQTLGNRPFKAGKQIVPDHLSGNQKFKQLVKTGAILVHPRDEDAVRLQASKDAMNTRKAEAARKQGLKLAGARDAGLAPHEVTEVGHPGTLQKIVDKKEKKKLNVPQALAGTPFIRPAPQLPKIAAATPVVDAAKGEALTPAASASPALTPSAPPAHVEPPKEMPKEEHKAESHTEIKPA